MGKAETRSPAASPDPAGDLRPLPHNLDAERAVLGSVLLNNEVLPIVLNHLRVEHFYDAGHRAVFKAIVRLEVDRVSIDPTTVCNLLRRENELELAGGVMYVAQLESAVLTTANVADHCEIVRDKALKRRLIRAAADIAENTYAEEEEAADLLASAQQNIFDIQSDHIGETVATMAQTTPEVMENIEQRMRDRHAYSGLRSGYDDLDELTGGFQKEDLLILAGRTSMGKTAFALCVAAHVALHQRKPLLFFSLEMSRHQLCQRILAMVSGVNLEHLRHSGSLSREQFARLLEASRPVGSSPFMIDDTPGIDIADLRTRARHIKSQNPDLALVVVDYLQLVTDNHGPRRSNDSRQNEVARISGALKAIAREIKVPLIALAQLSRQVEQRRGKDKTPMLSDLRESGAIEQDADMVMFVHRPDYYLSPSERPDPNSLSRAQVLVRKHRNGRTGAVDLLFHPPTARFVQEAPDGAAPPAEGDEEPF